MTRNRAGTPQDCVSGTNSGPLTIGTGSVGDRSAESVDACLCGVCSKHMRPGRSGSPKRFCSIGCRRLAWALRLLSAALEAGEAKGLRQAVRELGRRA